MKLSALSQLAKPFYVMELVKAADQWQAKGKDIIHLSIGEPDFGVPDPVSRAMVDAMANRRTGYTSALGIRPLREAISLFYAERFQANVPADNIVITAGASSALLFACLALINPTEEVLLTDPGYPCNKTFVQTAGGDVVYLNPPATQGFQPFLKDIQSAWRERTAGALLASPANPTGTRIPTDELLKIANWIAQQSGFLIVDEIYHLLAYHSEPTSIVQRIDVTSHAVCVVNSFSKYFGMTGLRLGWLVVPDHLIEAIEKFSQNLSICPNTPTQWAALACFQEETLRLCEERRQTFETRLDFMLSRLPEIGFDIQTRPDGAFYVYAPSPMKSTEYCHRLLENTGVCIVPGIDFSDSHGEEMVRFSYANSIENIDKALERIAAYHRQLGLIT